MADAVGFLKTSATNPDCGHVEYGRQVEVLVIFISFRGRHTGRASPSLPKYGGGLHGACRGSAGDLQEVCREQEGGRQPP